MDAVSHTPPPLQPHAFIDGVPAFAWSALQDGSLELANQACLDYTGFPLDQLRADWKSLLHPDDQAEYIRWWDELQKFGQPGQTEARWRRADGEYRWFHQSAAPVHDPRGNVIRWYGINVDIDDRKRA